MSVVARAAAAFGRLSLFQRGAVIIGGGVLGFVLLMVFRPRPPRQDPPLLAPLVAVVDAVVRSGALEVAGNGTVRPRSEVLLAPQVGGRVAWTAPALVSGGRFRAGTTLLQIESNDYENAVEIASAEVAQRTVEVLQAEEEVTLAREEFERLREREGIELATDSTALGSLIFREPQLEAARASLRRAEARLRDAELSLSRTSVRAPFDGLVRTESVDRGQFVAPGQGIAVIYATDEVEIVVPLTDEEASLIDGLWEARSGEVDTRIPATVSADFGGRTYRWSGYVDRAEGALNPDTRTVDVVVRVPDPFGTDSLARPPLLLGTYVTLGIQGRHFDHYVVVPRTAFRDGDAVWVVEADTLLRIVPARLIQEVDGLVFLEAELPPGAQVVSSSLDVVTDSMTVRVPGKPSS